MRKMIRIHTILFLSLLSWRKSNYGQTVHKIVTDSTEWVDFSGAWGATISSSMLYFDSRADPKNGITTPDNTNGNMNPNDAVNIYRGANRSRLLNCVLDSVYVITEIWAFDVSSAGDKDTINIQLGDSARSANWLRTYYNGRQTTVEFATTGLGGGWRRVWQGKETTQYITLNIRRLSYIHPVGGYPVHLETQFNDFIFYGYGISAGDTTFMPLSYGQVLAIDEEHAATFRELTGTNLPNNPPVIADLDGIYRKRKYIQMSGYEPVWFDSTYPKNTFKNQPQKDISSVFWYDSSMKTREPYQNIYIDFNGPNNFVYSHNGGQYAYRSTDSMNQNANDPFNYRTIASNMYMFGKFNTGTQDAYTRYKNGYPTNFRGNYSDIEWNNEPDGYYFPNYFMNTIENGVMFSACADGFKGAMGPGFGIRNSDPSIKIILPGTTGWNYQYQRATLRFLMFLYGSSSAVPVDRVGIHIYHVSKKTGKRLGAEDQIGVHVTYPENLGYQQEIDKVNRNIYQIFRRYLPVDFNEYGADKSFLRRTQYNSDTSLYGVVQFNTYNEQQSHSLWHERASIQLSISSAAYAAMFMWTDTRAPSPNFKYGDYEGSGVKNYDWGTPSNNRTWAGWFGWIGAMKRVADYKKVQIIDSTSGGLYVIKYRHKNFPDSTLVIIYKAAAQTGAGIPYILHVGDAQKVILFQSSFTSQRGTESKPKIFKGLIATIATVKPKYFFYTEENQEMVLLPGNFKK